MTPTLLRTTRRRPHATAYAVLLGLAALLVALAAPGATTAANAAPTPAPPGGAWVRVGHFVPGMGTAEVVLEPTDPGGSAATPMGRIDYGTVSDYEQLAPGSYTATVSAPGEDGGDEPLLSSTLDVAAGEARTVAVVGTSDQPRLTVLTDDLTPPAAGTARVRLLSASEQMGSVTVRALQGPTVADGAVLGQVTPYADVPAGDWTLAVSSGGTEGARQQVSLASGAIYTLVLLDTPGGGVELETVTDAAGATVTPRGGADTGGGGTAHQPTGLGAAVARLLALALR